MVKYSKTKEDFIKEIQDNLYLLKLSCESYDKGIRFSALDIATRLRVLLHDTASSTSLFTHIGYKETIEYIDTADEVEPNNLLPTLGLVSMKITDSNVSEFHPLLKVPPYAKLITFEEWWNKKVIYKNGNHELTRKRVITNVANKDGGTHSDSKLTEGYYTFSRQGGGWESVNVEFSGSKDDPDFKILNENNNTDKKYVENLHYASVRQIAFELMESLRRVS